MCVVIPFILDARLLDVPAGVTQDLSAFLLPVDNAEKIRWEGIFPLGRGVLSEHYFRYFTVYCLLTRYRYNIKMRQRVS